MRFYGLSYREVSDLYVEEANELDLATTALEAQEMLMGMQVADYPYLKKQPKQLFYKKIRKLAFNYDNHKQKTASVEDFVQSFVRSQSG